MQVFNSKNIPLIEGIRKPKNLNLEELNEFLGFGPKEPKDFKSAKGEWITQKQEKTEREKIYALYLHIKNKRLKQVNKDSELNCQIPDSFTNKSLPEIYKIIQSILVDINSHRSATQTLLNSKGKVSFSTA